MGKDFLSINDLTPQDVREVLTIAKVTKHMHRWGQDPKILTGKHAALIFRKPSLRTRASFETGVVQLGGHPMFITDAEIGLGKRESTYDVAKVLSRYYDLIVIRTFDQKEVEDLARFAEVPVINALTDLLHPCQIMGDIFTVMEHKNRIDNLIITYLGDGGNNIANSWVELAGKIPMELRIGTTGERIPDVNLTSIAKAAGISNIVVTTDPIEAIKDADVVYTDVWASMGEKDKLTERMDMLKEFQVNAKLMSYAKPDAIVMHCLPANRGQEITDEVIDSPQSVVFDEAENRLHIQKAIILQLFGAKF